MVYVKSADGIEKKFACSKCIKGHRSSKCRHDKRELIEIKRKGRPVSQCETCRLLRKTKQIHIKCICPLKAKDTTANNAPTTTTIPVVPLNVNNTNYNNLDAILVSTSCLECNRPKLYCNCKNPSMPFPSTADPITPPAFMSGSAATKIIPSYPGRFSAGLTNNTCAPDSTNNSLPSSPIRHLTIPIHDPSDDIDSDTPIYKSVEETTHLGEFTNKSSDELMTQIYSRFSSSSCLVTIKEDVDDDLIELSRNIDHL